MKRATDDVEAVIQWRDAECLAFDAEAIEGVGRRGGVERSEACGEGVGGGHRVLVIWSYVAPIALVTGVPSSMAAAIAASVTTMASAADTTASMSVARVNTMPELSATASSPTSTVTPAKLIVVFQACSWVRPRAVRGVDAVA